MSVLISWKGVRFMIEITGTGQKAAWDHHLLPPVEQLQEGVWSIPVPFPNNPMRYTLSYLLMGESGCVVIDPGFDSDQGWRALLQGLRQADVGVSDVTGVVATHFHSDHLGMAGRLREASGAWLGLGKDEIRYISDYSDLKDEIVADQRRMQLWGVPSDRIPEAAMSASGLRELSDLPDPDVRFSDTEQLLAGGLTLNVMATPGHTPGHICLWDNDGRFVFSGDHILPRISPNVSLEMRGPYNPVAQNLASLEKMSESDEPEVCPAHEYRFRGLSYRAAQLSEHTRKRSREVQSALVEVKNPTVWNIAKALTWSRGWSSLGNLQLRLALSETAAHLTYLQSQQCPVDVAGLPPATDYWRVPDAAGVSANLTMGN
jgi:glyoxylase-like metal-dependent hydrolase (beta-lactamase superfamily II)